MMSIEICNGYSKCTFIIEKTNFVDIHNRVSIDTILTLKSSDDIKKLFSRTHFLPEYSKKFNSKLFEH